MKHSVKWMALCIAAAFATPTFSAPVLDAHPTPSSALHQQKINAWLEIDTQAFEQNIATLQSQLQGQSKICAVMKADAYGNGIALLMPSVIKMKVPCVAIASNSEARVVRASGYKGQIIRVRTATLDEIRDAMKYNMTELIGNPDQASAISQLAQKHGKTLSYHLALNSAGMSRNGLDLSTDAGKQAALAIAKLPHLKITGIMTHFPVEEKADVEKG